MNLLTDNIGTIVISLVIVGIVILIIRKMRKDKKSGGSCGCGCSGCSGCGDTKANNDLKWFKYENILDLTSLPCAKNVHGRYFLCYNKLTFS